ncbi:hypothetical protein [Chryseobacterium sp.]|uniref:hypothetical protein n=1 Tax=Chryseobacterium sp. TaxID=1871047 RepID=UPI00262561C0|nr:hypothetical protein [Chryseobacterium sp.]
MSRNKNTLIILIFIAILFLYNIISPSKNSESFLDKMREREIKSIISKKYINYANHNIPFLVYGNQDSIVIYRDWYDEVSVGDSIIKPNGSLEIVIKSSNEIKRFNYKDKFGLE